MSEEAERKRMVREQLEARGITDVRVLDAMERVPRHLFVPEAVQSQAYDDRPQPIGAKQTISQPLMVAQMTQLLGIFGDEFVLEVGTGSGYQTAILAELTRQVVSVERHETLADRARELLTWLGYQNVAIYAGDGSQGFASSAPYDRILVTAASPSVPQPLIDQLQVGGRLVIPVGSHDMQTLQVIRKTETGEVVSENHGECVFVPLIGEHGWNQAED